MGFFSKLFGGGGESKPKSYAGQNLVMQSFEGKDLRGCDFSKAEATMANFTGANLEGANFREATLMQANFTNANLKGAALDGANVGMAIFTGANMEGVSTHGTDMFGVIGAPTSAFSSLDDIMEDDQKWPVMRQKLDLLAAIAPGGAVRERRDDSEMFYAGTFKNRNFRVIQSLHGSLSMELKVSSGVEFSVHYDKEAEATHGGGDADPVWGDSNATQRHFFGPGVYIEGDKAELAQTKARINGDLPGMFGHFIAAANVERFDVSSDLITLSFNADSLSGDFPQRMRVALEFTDKVAGQLGI